MQDGYHTPVLVAEIIEYLVTKPDGVYVDATLGGGGHSEKILEKLQPTGVLIGIDADEDAINFTKMRFGERILFIHSNFSNLSQELSKINIHKIDGILFDLGISSYQIDMPEKGFSYREAGNLDFRFDLRQSLDGYTVINTYPEENLSDIFFHYGEEKFSRKIARKICYTRRDHDIKTTTELAKIIESVVGQRFLNKTLSRIFQAIRIEVNQEIECLKTALSDSVKVLNTGGRLVVISYHSIEDKIVKDFIKEKSRTKIWSGNKLIPDTKITPELISLTKKPIIAQESEIKQNIRARSAKLRVAERV